MLDEYIAATQLEQLAEERASLSQELKPEGLPRLSGLCVEGGDKAALSGKLEANFAPTPSGAVELRVQAEGEIQLTCQRCLGPVAVTVDVDSRLVLAPEGLDLGESVDEFDVVRLEAGRLKLRDVIEDELLGGLPIAPMHEPGLCAGEETGSYTDTAAEADADTHRPFGNLAALMERE